MQKIQHLKFSDTKVRRDVIKYFMRGYSNAEIGKRIGCAERTIKSYIATLFREYSVQEKGIKRINLAVAIHSAGECPCTICAIMATSNPGLPKPKASLRERVIRSTRFGRYNKPLPKIRRKRDSWNMSLHAAAKVLSKRKKSVQAAMHAIEKRG